MTDRYDAIVVGAGHNGLVCAALLAKGGRNVLVLEAADAVGGAAVNREFAPGFSAPACAHLLYQLQPAVQKALGIKPNLTGDILETIALADDGNSIRLGDSAVSGVSDHDVAAYRTFRLRVNRYADLMEGFLNTVPPRLGVRRRRDLLKLARLGFDIRRMGRGEMREFLRLIGMNIHDELVERFESPLLKGAIALDAVLGTHLGPRSPGSFATYLHRLAGNHGRLSIPAGGLSAVCEDIARIARDAGATIRTGQRVKSICVENGRIGGVETENGDVFNCYTVVSNADPKTTVMQLVGARHFETGFVRRIHQLRARGNAAKLHLALTGPPEFTGLSADDLRQRIVIAPDEHYVERAFNPAKYGEASSDPVIEITLPSLVDPSIAPAGQHVLSAVVQYAPYALKGGWHDDTRENFERTVVQCIARYFPGLESMITASELLTPADIEAQFGITGGHWHHGEITLDQFLFVRPVPGAAQYALPLEGLYLCGAGSHGGGGFSGAPGRNTAERILHREKYL